MAYKNDGNFLGFYYVDKNYADYLRNPKIGDVHIPYIEYNERNKFFIGAVLKVNGMNYFAPVTSFNKKDDGAFNIYENNGKHIISSVRLNYMFPVVEGVFWKLDIPSITDSHYKKLVTKEYFYCNRRRDQILEKAKNMYSIRLQGNMNTVNVYINNFSKLEKAAMNYKPAVKISLQNPIADKYGLTEEQYDIAKKFAEKFDKPLEQVIRSNIAFAPDSHYDSSIKSNVIAEEAAKRKQQNKTQEKNISKPVAVKTKKSNQDQNSR